MCMPPIPRLQVADELLPIEDPRFGLFSASTVIENMDPFAQNGVQYSAICDPAVTPYPLPPCTPIGNPTKVGTRSEAIVTADPFVVYAAETCPPLGRTNEQARARLRDRILMGERHTVEAIVYNGLVGARPFLRDPQARIINGGTPTDIAEAVGLLEQHLSAMGRSGVIHAPRWMAPVMDSLPILHRSGARLTTILGTPIAFGSGYSGAAPYGVEDPGENSWLYATAGVTIYRSPIYEPGSYDRGAFDPATNRTFLLAERVYVVTWPCQVLAILTTAPAHQDIVPLPPVPVPTMIVSPTHGPQPLQVTVYAATFGAGDLTVDMGDGSAPLAVPDGGSVTYTYAEAGTYTVTGTNAAFEVPVTETVTVTGLPAAPAPTVSVDPASGTAPLEVQATVDNHGNGPVTIDWGDGSATVVNPGDGTTASAHTYAEAGSYTVTVTSQANPTAQGTAQVQVASAPAPIVTATPDSGQATLATQITVDNHGNGPVDLDFGDGSATVTNPGDGTTPTAHSYTTAGTFTVTATSQADPEVQGATQVAVTAPEPPALVAAPTTGVAPLQVDLTVDNHGNGPVALDPGDGSAPITNPGDGTTASTHTYAEPGTFTVTATSQADPTAQDTAQVTVTAPADPTVAATPSTGTAPLEVQVTVDNDGNGPVTLDFGDGSATVTNPGDGTTASTHTYTAPGTFTVTATSQAFPDAQGTAQVQVDAADPVVAVTPDTGPVPLEVQVTVDNHGQGPVEVDLGDGTAPTTNPGDGTTPTAHTYTNTGPFTVTATSQADPTKQGTAQVNPTAPAAPVVAADPASGPAPLTTQITVDNHGNGPVEVDFGDGAGPVTNPGDGTTASAHTYTAPDTYTVTATSQAFPDAQGTTQVEVTTEPPALTLDPTSGPLPLLVDVSVDNHGNGPVMVDPGDGSEPYEDPGEGEPLGVSYGTEGEYTVTITSVADPQAVTTGTVTVGPQADPIVTLAPTPGTPLSVDITVNNYSLGPLDMDYGDGTTGTHPGIGIQEHLYAAADTYTVTATSQADPTAVGSAQITVTA